MRFVNQQYQDLAGGYVTAKSLDAEFETHPAFLAFQKRQAVRHRKRLKRIGITTGLIWAVLPWTVFACLLGNGVRHQWGGTLSSLACVVAAATIVVGVGFTIHTVRLAQSSEWKKGRWSIYQRWLNTVSSSQVPGQDALYSQFSRSSDPDLEEHTRYGAQGVWKLLHYLTMYLSDEWFALTNIMVSRSEDADVVIVGPSGIWVLESKYWSGYINIEHNTWSRVRVYYAPGGRRHTEYVRVDKPWDEQWLRQRGAIVRILKGAQASFDDHEPSDLIGGGIALSHPQARLNADGSQKAPIGTLVYWGSKMRQSEISERLRPEDRLRVVDSLLSASRRHHRTDRACESAKSLARRIYEDILVETREA